MWRVQANTQRSHLRNRWYQAFRQKFRSIYYVEWILTVQLEKLFPQTSCGSQNISTVWHAHRDSAQIAFDGVRLDSVNSDTFDLDSLSRTFGQCHDFHIMSKITKTMSQVFCKGCDSSPTSVRWILAGNQTNSHVGYFTAASCNQIETNLSNAAICGSRAANLDSLGRQIGSLGNVKSCYNSDSPHGVEFFNNKVYDVLFENARIQ